jgi:hypothetical protein
MDEKNDKMKMEGESEGEKFEKMAKSWFKENVGEEWGKEMKGKKCKEESKVYKTGAGTGAGVYCLGFIGALVYYIQVSVSFWDGVLGILKSFVWPAFLVHGILKFLGL